MNEQNNIAQPAIVVTLTRTLGAYGAAFDLPGPHRAFTYHHQPGNIGAHRLGAAWQKAASGSSGDLIDRGLGLLNALQEVGFGVFEVSEIAAPVAEERAACPTDVCKAGQADAVLCANDECDRANGVRPPMCRIPGVREDVLRRAALASAPVAANVMPGRQALLDAIHRYGNARAMAEHNTAYRDEVRNTADALIALFDAAPAASADAGVTASGPVRNAALEEAAMALVQMDAKRSEIDVLVRAIKLIRALKTVADKDGGKQRTASTAPKLPNGWQLALDLAIDAIENAAPMDWPVNWPAILHGLKALRAALSPSQAEQGDAREA